MSKRKIHKISFREADGYDVTEEDILKRELTQRSLYGKQFLYSAFKPSLMPLVLKTGTFHRQDKPRRDEIFVFEVNQDETAIEYGLVQTSNLASYLAGETRQGNRASFAVYNRTKMRTSERGTWYEFVDPNNKLEALVAVFEVDLTPDRVGTK